jgi:hypothetical protein
MEQLANTLSTIKLCKCLVIPRGGVVFVGWVECSDTHRNKTKSTSPVVDRQLVTFFCFARRK